MNKRFYNIIIAILLAIMAACVLIMILENCSFYYQYAEPSTFKGKAEVIKIEPNYAVVSAGFVREFWKLTGKTELYLNYLMYQYEDGDFMVKKEMIERYKVLKGEKKWMKKTNK